MTFEVNELVVETRQSVAHKHNVHNHRLNIFSMTVRLIVMQFSQVKVIVRCVMEVHKTCKPYFPCLLLLLSTTNDKIYKEFCVRGSKAKTVL